MTSYVDYQGISLPRHNGKSIFISEEVGYQYFGIDGKGFIHNGTSINLPNGKKQFFLPDGKAVIHDGSPIELSDGQMIYFDQDGIAMGPINEKKITPLFTEQRNVFFDDRIAHINKQTPLDKNEIEELRLALLAAEHPDYINNSIQNANIQEGKKIKLQALSPETEEYLILLKGFWWQIWRDFQFRHREALAARYILKGYRESGCSLAKSSLAESILENELKFEFKKAQKNLNPPVDFYEIRQIEADSEGIFALDSGLLNYVKNNFKGKHSEVFIKLLADEYSDKSFSINSRRKAWQHPLFVYRCLADLVWLERIKAKIEAFQKKPPALTYVVNEQVHQPMRPGTAFDKITGKILDKQGKELALLDYNESKRVLPSINIDSIQKILQPENIKVLSTVNAHRLLRWEIQTVTKQFVEGMVDARSLKVCGGYKELANLLGIGNNRRAAEQLRDIIIWQAAPRYYGPDGRYGNMLSFDYTPSGYKRPAILQLVLGNMMLPNYVYELLKMPESQVGDRRLIPIVDMPPLIGRPNDQGAQPGYQIEILVEMRKRAKEFANNGCVQISKDRLSELAKNAGLSKQLFLKVIDRWIQDGNDAPAFLKIVEDDHYALGNHYKQAQDFIVEAGRKEIAMSKAGKKSVAKRNSGNFKN